MKNSPFLEFSRDGARCLLRPQGAWTLPNAALIESALAQKPNDRCAAVTIDAVGLEQLDTAGAVLLHRLLRNCGANEAEPQLINFTQQHRNIIELVRSRLANQATLEPVRKLTFVQRVGAGTVLFYRHSMAFVSFLGAVVSQLRAGVMNPRLIRWRESVVQLERVGVDSIPVVALVTGLIGIVMAYLLAEQLRKYGGNIFIADGVSIAMCREFSPMIVAIIMAGRSGSAFTAELGSMKLNQEVDAMVTLGLSPIHVLVLPRILALIVSLPLLVFVGNIVGTAGGMFVADFFLGVTPATFLDRLQVALPLRQVWVGLWKAPIFAAVIALIGCRMGLSVENNTRSVGLNTTSTVVQSIVAVILLDAFFAVLLQELHI